MWQPSDWIALGALIVAGVSAGAAIVSVAYTWWDRSGARADSYRSALYHRQLDATAEFVTLVREAHAELAEHRPADASAWVSEAQGRFIEYAVQAVYMPPEVVRAAADWLQDVADALEAEGLWLLNATDSGAEPPPESSRARQLDAAWIRFMKRVRAETGAPDLHPQLRKLTGAAQRESKLRDTVARLAALDVRVEVMSRGRIQAPPIRDVEREVRDRDL